LKNAIVVIAAMLFLVGCGSAGEKEKEEAESSHATSVKNVEENEKEQKESGIATKDKPEERKEEQAVSQGNVQAAPEYRMKDDFSIENIKNPEEKIVLLTIDDAPNKNSLTMAKTLLDLKVKAIFFVNGHFIDTPEEGEVLRQIHKMGFPIGNHTFNHKTLKDLTEEQQRQEIVGLNDRIEELIGERPRFFRAPFGINTEYSKQVAAEEKMLLMNWTYGYDWEKEYQTKESLAVIMVNTPLLRNGANLLMHDRDWTSAALGDIVKGLQNKGFIIADPNLVETPQNKETAAQ
jgi:peptidoglycan/xylan/chitin deacetylase (PgdA/CDA1 family)